MRVIRSLVLASMVAALAVTAAVFLTSEKPASAHCQIPCGIYGDAMRFEMLREHIATIEKSMNQVVELSEDPSGNANQLTRWVMNKEGHAEQFEEIVTKYFLQQRIKVAEPGSDDWDAYVHKVTLCHNMLVTSMKTKQTTDLGHVEKLRDLVDAFEKAYFPEGSHSHDHGHGHSH